MGSTAEMKFHAFMSSDPGIYMEAVGGVGGVGASAEKLLTAD